MASYPPPPPPPPPGYGPPGYGPPGYGPPPGYGYGPTRSTHGKAVAALVCGIGAFVVSCPFVAIAAVILGPQARREIAADPARYEGDGLAKAGQILGWVNIGLWVVGIIIVIIAVVLGVAFGGSSSTTYESLAGLAA